MPAVEESFGLLNSSSSTADSIDFSLASERIRVSNCVVKRF
jgi:hypothetical protein